MTHIPGMGILASLPDYLHTKHLGVDAQFVGAVLLALITVVMSGDVNASLDILWDEIKKLYKTSHTANRLGVLTHNMIKKGKATFPCLSARGYQIRDFLPVMMTTLTKHMDAGNAAHRDMFVGLTTSWDIEKTLVECKGMFSLPVEETETLNKNCILVCKCITSLTKAASAFKNMFNFTIKTHSLLHLGERATYINPQ